VTDFARGPILQGDRWFESTFLHRRVTCEPEFSVSAHHHSRHRVGIGDICLDRYDVSARRRNFRGPAAKRAYCRFVLQPDAPETE
jgi:hypothetical protein